MECNYVLGVSNYSSLSEVNVSRLSQQLVREYRMCLSSESFKQRMPVVVYLSVVSVLGVTGNIVVMWVFSLDSRVTSYRIFVLCMGVQDFLTSSLGLPLQLLSIRHAYNTYSTLFCRAMFALTTLPTQASSAILVAVALDRLHRVCWPHVRHLTPREALRVCVLLTVFVWCVFAAFIPLYGINNYPSAVPGLDVKMCWIYDDFVSTQYVTVYSIVVEIIFYLSMFLMTGAYFMIGVKIWRQFLRKRKIIAETYARTPTATPPSSLVLQSHRSFRMQDEVKLYNSSNTASIFYTSSTTSLAAPDNSGDRESDDSSNTQDDIYNEPGDNNDTQDDVYDKPGDSNDTQDTVCHKPGDVTNKQGDIHNKQSSGSDDVDTNPLLIDSSPSENEKKILRSSAQRSRPEDIGEQASVKRSQSCDVSKASVHADVHVSAPNDRKDEGNFPANMRVDRNTSLGFLKNTSPFHEQFNVHRSNEEHFASTVHLKNSACSVKLLPSIALLSSSVDNARDAGSVKDVPDTVPLLSTSVHNKSEDEGRAEQCKPSSPVPENSRLPRRTGNQLKTTRKRLTFDVQPHQPGASANRKLSMGVSPTVARAYARRLSSGRSIHRHRRKTSHTTFMMAMLALCYVINWMPHLIIRLNNLDPIDLCSQFTCCDNRDALSLRSYYLSSAVNVFVYSIWSETFQATCRQLFRKYWNKLRQPSSMSRGL